MQTENLNIFFVKKKIEGMNTLQSNLSKQHWVAFSNLSGAILWQVGRIS